MDYRRVVIVLLAVFLGYLGVKFLLPLFTPFILGLFFAGIIEPIIIRLEEWWHWSRPVAVFLTLTISLMVVFLLIAVILGCVYQEIVRLIGEISRYTDISRMMNQHWSDIVTYIQKYVPREFAQSASMMIQNFLVYIGRSIMGLLHGVERIPDLIGTIILAVLTAYFVTRDKRFWIDIIRRYLPRKWQSGFEQVGRKLIQGILNLFRLELIMMLMAFFLTGSVLSLMGNPRSWLIGLAVGLLEPLPMVGPGAILLPWSGWLFFIGQWPFAVILLIICGVLMGSRQWLEIRLLGGGSGIHPLFTLIGLYLGLKLFGLIGLIIAPLTLSMAGSLYSLLLSRWNLKEENSL